MNTIEEFQEFLTELYKNKIIVFDTETTGLKPYAGDKVCGIAFYLPSNHQTYYIPIIHGFDSFVVPADRVAGALELWFSDPTNTAIGHNTKFDMHFVQMMGVPMLCRFEDTMLLAHLFNENEFNYKLKDLGVKYINPDAKDEQSMMNYQAACYGFKDGAIKHIKELPSSVVAPYAMKDVILTWELYCYYMQRMDIRQPNRDVVYGVGTYLSAVQDMERRGILIDIPKCQEMVEICTEKANQLEQDAYELAGREFNMGSWQQVRAVLNVSKSDEEFLESLNSPLASAIVECRKWKKAKGTYFESFLDKVDKDGYIHPSFHISGTVTGRLSCSDPNFQNIPRDSDLYKVKSVVIAPEGYSLVTFDYSQVELRLQAYYSQDQNLLKAYREGLDIHAQTAEAVGISRSKGKTLNFAMSYGAGVDQIMSAFGVEREEAMVMLHRYHSHFPGIRRLAKNSEIYAREHGVITYWTGRNRHFGSSKEFYKAGNSLIQGGVSEIMRISITNLQEKMRNQNCWMILQVHDEIASYCKDSELDKWIPTIKDTMENYKFDINNDPATEVKIIAEGKKGKSWGSMTKL